MEDTALIVSQAFSILLLAVSEILALTDSPYNGILHFIIKAIVDKLPPKESSTQITKNIVS